MERASEITSRIFTMLRTILEELYDAMLALGNLGVLWADSSHYNGGSGPQLRRLNLPPYRIKRRQ